MVKFNSTHFILLMIATLSVVFSSCQKMVEPFSSMIEVPLELNNTEFNKLQVDDGLTVRIYYGAARQSASITCNTNIISYVHYEIVGGTLIVRFKRGYVFGPGLKIEVNIYVRSLEEISAAGGSIVALYNEVNDDLGLVISGGSSAVAPKLNVQNLKVDISGGGIASLKGYAYNADLKCSGGSGVRDYDLTIDILNLKMSGGGYSCLTVTSVINAELSGGSILKYMGTATLNNIKKTGGSQILKQD